MIVFDLICKDQHRFEGWFTSGEDFTSQQSRGLLNCPVCGGAHVEKLPAAKIRKQAAEPVAIAPSSAARAVQGERMDISRVIDYILTHSEDVGKSFAEEARKIHYGETDPRGIYGETSKDEAQALADEGVEFARIPWLPRHDS